MDEKIVYKTSEYTSFIKDIGIAVVVDSNPSISTIKRIKKLLKINKIKLGYLK